MRFLRRLWRKYDIEWKLQMFWTNHGGYRMALWVDQRHPDYCWADVCTKLGMAYDLRNWREAAEQSEGCKRDCAEQGTCWCGKFADHERLERDRLARLAELEQMEAKRGNS